MEYLKDVMSSKNYEIYYKTAKSQVDNPLHYHDYLEIYYHKEGACDYISDSRIYTLRPGDIVVIRKQKLHKAVVKDFTSEYKRYVVWMTNEFIETLIQKEEYREIIFNRKEDAELLRLPAVNSEKIREILDNLVEESEQNDSISKDLLENYLRELLLLLCKYSKSSFYIRKVEPRQDPIVKEVMEYLDRHVLDRVSLDEVAENFYMNKFHLMRKFKKHTQMTLMEYLKKKRLMIARNLIADGEPIQTIYRRCGFEDYTNFYRAFKSIYFMSPREYKEYIQAHNHNVLMLRLDGGGNEEEH